MATPVISENVCISYRIKVYHRQEKLAINTLIYNNFFNLKYIASLDFYNKKSPHHKDEETFLTKISKQQ
ncbi:hypothetical protein ACYSNN_08165, partial [Peptoniphilus genitalis]